MAETTLKTNGVQTNGATLRAATVVRMPVGRAKDKAGNGKQAVARAEASTDARVQQRRVLGKPIKRREDAELLHGDGKFTADLTLPGMVHMALLRSEHAHARILSIDTRAAQRMPGVLRVITAADIENKIMPLPCIWIPGGAESHFPSHPMGVPGGSRVLAQDVVRYIGDPVAAVIAETREQAHDALAAIRVTYQPLPVVTRAEDALKPGAPQLHDEVPGNLNAHTQYGDRAAAERAIANAEVVIEQRMEIPRTINSPIEPRAALGHFDSGSGEYTLYASSQSPHNHRLLLALMILGVPMNKVRIVAPNIGGSFGTKGYIYPDMPLVLWLSKELGRPVKWVDSRDGLMRSTVQGRDQVVYATLAGTRDGRITGLRATSYANLGAYPSTIGPGVATAMVGRSITGAYDIKNAFCEVFAAFTNTVSLGAQRGSGRAEATFVMERLVDQFAREIGMDPLDVRRKNIIKPAQFPFDNGLGWKYDSGNYPVVLEKAAALAGYDDIAARKAEAATRGKRLGVGIASFVAISGVGPSPRMSKEGMLGGTWESALVRVHPTGEVTLIIGSKPHGQSHETTFAQVVAEELGIDPNQIEVLHSDTKRAPFGQGSYGSRSFSVGGEASLRAAQAVRAKAVKMAAHMFKTDESNIVFAGGKLYPQDAPEKAQTLQEVALALWYGWDLPAGMEPTLEATVFFDPPDFNYPYGTHIAFVEVDEQTGETSVVRYIAVNDVGTPGNAAVLDGQVHGGIVHGIGQALYEQALYGEDGQLHSRTLADYALPRAEQLPLIETTRLETPTPHTQLGAKGAGEVGTVGAAAAVANAVVDALADLGVRHIDMPLTPEKVWKVIHDHKSI